MFMTVSRKLLNRGLAVALVVGGLSLSARPASAQDAITKESAAAIKAAFIADLEVMHGKFVGLAQAFGQQHVPFFGLHVFSRIRREVVSMSTTIINEPVGVDKEVQLPVAGSRWGAFRPSGRGRGG